MESLTKQRDSLNRFAQRVGLTSDEVTEGIAAVEALRRRGVLPGAMVFYQKVLSETNTDPQSFQKVVEEFGGVEQALAARHGELKRLEREFGVSVVLNFPFLISHSAVLTKISNEFRITKCSLPILMLPGIP